MDRNQITLQTWNKVAQLYQEKFMDLDLYNDTYDRFCHLIERQNPEIFEIACGPGNITRYILKRMPGCKLTAIDASPIMVELAKHNNPTGRFYVMDCRIIHTITEKFDAIICGFCIPYLSKSETEMLFRNCYNLLNHGGIFYFSAIRGDHTNSGFETASTGDQTFVYYYDELYLQQQLSQCNFKLIDIQYKNHVKANRQTSVDMIFILRKT